jgi:hypothetical protein
MKRKAIGIILLSLLIVVACSGLAGAQSGTYLPSPTPPSPTPPPTPTLPSPSVPDDWVRTVMLDWNRLDLTVGEKGELNATLPPDLQDCTIDWRTTNPTIATVTANSPSATVEAVGLGSCWAMIVVTCDDTTYYDACEVRVTAGEEAVATPRTDGNRSLLFYGTISLLLAVSIIIVTWRKHQDA